MWWEERTIRKLAKGDKGWKPNRTATKSLGRWNSFSAVAPLQFLLMLGCRGRQERFIRSVPHWEKDLGRCFRSFLALARKMDSKESEKLRWEDFKQYHGELSIKYLLMRDWKNKQFGNISLYLSSYNENFKCFSTNNFIWEDWWGKHCTQALKKGRLLVVSSPCSAIQPIIYKILTHSSDIVFECIFSGTLIENHIVEKWHSKFCNQFLFTTSKPYILEAEIIKLAEM